MCSEAFTSERLKLGGKGAAGEFEGRRMAGPALFAHRLPDAAGPSRLRARPFGLKGASSSRCAAGSQGARTSTPANGSRSQPKRKHRRPAPCHERPPQLGPTGGRPRGRVRRRSKLLRRQALWPPAALPPGASGRRGFSNGFSSTVCR